MESPPPPRHPSFRVPAARGHEALAELTVALIQTMNKSSYYEPGHPAHFAVRDELYDGLMGVLDRQAQLGYVVQRGTTPEIWVDGLEIGRVKLSEIILGGVYDLFVPRFVEYFDRYELVLLAFRQGLTREEFGSFVTVMTRPVTRREQRFDLSQALLDAGVLNVSVLCAEEVSLLDRELPWQVRVCLARLRRDLRAIPLFKSLGAEAIRRAKRQVFADVVRPLTHAELLKQLVVFAPRVERDLADIEDLRGIDVAETVVEVLAPRPLLELARVLSDTVERGGRQADEVQASAKHCAERILREKPADSEPVLRMLHRSGVVPLELLDEQLQEALAAEQLRAARAKGAAVPLPRRSLRDARVLGRLGRLEVAAGGWDVAAEVAEVLSALTASPDELLAGAARGELDALLTDGELASAVAQMEGAPAAEAEALGRLVRALGRRGAAALAKHIVDAGAGAMAGGAFHALAKMPRSEIRELVAGVLEVPRLPARVAELMLSLAGRHADARLAEAARAYAFHPEPGVRRGALEVAIATGGGAAVAALRAALADPDPRLATAAMVALADRHAESPEVFADALKVLASVRPDQPSELLRAALHAVSRYPAAAEERDMAIEVLEALLDLERPHSGLFGIGKKSSPHPDLVADAEETLRALGHARKEAQGGRAGLLDRFRR